VLEHERPADGDRNQAGGELVINHDRYSERPHDSSALPGRRLPRRRVPVTAHAQEAAEVGMDDTSDAGTWTLTARSGNYRLECRAIANPGVDCGNHFPGGPSTVEMGKLRGTSPTVWFVHDMAQMSKLTGCTPELAVFQELRSRRRLSPELEDGGPRDRLQ
jgi:hypothetical protein